MATGDCSPEYCTKSVLVLGCGNVLLGDDGFGPAVVEHIVQQKDVPENVCFLNVETSSREILFDITLSEKRPRKIIVVDAMECGREVGMVVDLSLDLIPEKKIDDFSMHQIPTSNLLREIRDFCGVEIELVVLQPADIPEEVRPGLSRAAERAVPQAARLVLDRCALEPAGT